MKTEKEVRGLFQLVDIQVLNIYKIQNQYLPEAENPWWLVKTSAGVIKIGPRKRVYSIDWEDTSIRKIITQDDVTKDDTYVHAWGERKLIEYLKELGKEINGNSNKIDLNELEAKIDKLKSLLQDRQPGMITWNQFLHDNLKDLKNLLKGI